MINEESLNSLLREYDVDSDNILGDKKTVLLSQGDYNRMNEILSFLRNDLSIKARKIENCPSILKGDIEIIKKSK